MRPIQSHSAQTSSFVKEELEGGGRGKGEKGEQRERKDKVIGKEGKGSQWKEGQRKSKELRDKGVKEKGWIRRKKVSQGKEEQWEPK